MESYIAMVADIRRRELIREIQQSRSTHRLRAYAEPRPALPAVTRARMRWWIVLARLRRTPVRMARETR